MITGDRQVPESGQFPQEIAPFAKSTDLVSYASTNPTPLIPPHHHHRSNLPPMKLRPIRYSSGEIPGAVEKVTEAETEEVEFLCEVNGQSSDYLGSPVKADADDVAGIGMGGGARDILVDHPEKFGSGSGEFSPSSDDDDDSSADVKEPANRKRKRKTSNKIELFLESLVMKVMEKQEQMHKQLIQMIEKREMESIIREEAWKQQEMERIKRDEEVRAQETSRSLTLISLIQNVLGNEIEISQPSMVSCMEGHGGKALLRKGSTRDQNNRRWPDAEVQALIMLRTSLEHKFRVMGSKSSIWDDISVGMSNMGYNRTARRCKEKWENINKYFRKAMENGKKPHENGKTCPYFQELSILYKNGLVNPGNIMNHTNNENVTGG